MSDPYEVKCGHGDGGDECALDSIATRLDLRELRKRIDGRRRPLSVMSVEWILARTEALEALLQELIDTPGPADRDPAIRARRRLRSQMAGALTGERAR